MKTKFNNSFTGNAFKYCISGFLVGLVFPIAGTLLSLRGFHENINAYVILNLHLQEPLLQIIDLAPIILSLIGLFIGLKTDQNYRSLKKKEYEKFRSLIEEAAEVIYITDYKGNFIYFNQSIQKVYGHPPEDLIGAHFTSLIKPSMIQKVANFYLNQFEKRIPQTVSDFQILDRDGNPRWVEQTVILKTKGDRIEGFQCIVRDIDNRIQQEEEIRSLNGTLRKKLTELESANQELSTFNHTVSHDLRAPLRGISTLAEIMQMEFESHLPEEARGLLSRIISNTNKIHTLVEDLLEFSKVGKQQINKTKVSMSDLVDQILQDLLPKDPDIKTSVQVDKLADSVCDHPLIRQVWTNFISNAIKYSAKKESPLIRIGNYFKNNDQIYFIKDNGAGFNMDYYHKLFGVFSRLHTETEFSGTGVGLSIVKRIIERHGGKVWAESQPDNGATFYFSIPIASTSNAGNAETPDRPVFHNVQSLK